MYISAPQDIGDVAWEGELVESEIDKAHKERGRAGGELRDWSFRELFHGFTSPSKAAARTRVTIGKPTIWPIGEALKNEVGKTWTPKDGDPRGYWLVRLAVTLHETKGLTITKAELSLDLRPAAANGEAFAQDLFPLDLAISAQRKFTFGLGPELKFGSAVELKAGEVGATLDYPEVFPVIKGFGVGQPRCWWTFKNHPGRPLFGSQCVWAVVAGKPAEAGVRALMNITAEVDREIGGLIRLGLPHSERARLDFPIPEQP